MLPWFGTEMFDRFPMLLPLDHALELENKDEKSLVSVAPELSSQPWERA